jgi:major inositol transporter-like SP family MFS transporter
MNLAKYDKKLLAIVFIATLGEFLFGYDTGVLAGAIFTIDSDFGIKAGSPASSFITASLIIGAVIGAFCAGRIADKFGRRRNMLVLACVFFCGTLLTSLSPNEWCIVGARVILGIAVGGASATVPVYISEISSTRNRGRMVAIDQTMIVTGQLVAYIMNAVINNVTGGGPGTWRWMIVVGTIPAVVLFFGMLRLPDTPRWLVVNGYESKAEQLLQKIRDAKRVKEELFEIKQRYEESKQEQSATIKDLATPWIKRLLGVGIIIAITQQITGVDTIMYYAPTILKATGLSTASSLTATVLNGVVSVLASIWGIWQVGRHARRKMLITGQVGIIASLALIGLTFLLFFKRQGVDASGNEIVTATFKPASYIVLLFMLTFLIFQQGYVSPVTWLMLSEIYPTKIRGLAMGLSTAILWAAKFFVVFAFPIMLSVLGGNVTFLTFAVVNVVVMLFVIFNVPETRGVSLEIIERSFEKKGRKIVKYTKRIKKFKHSLMYPKHK